MKYPQHKVYMKPHKTSVHERAVWGSFGYSVVWLNPDLVDPDDISIIQSNAF